MDESEVAEDLSSLDERHIRAFHSEVIKLYRQEMLDKNRSAIDRLQAAQLLEQALVRYERFLWNDQAQELAQLQRILGQWRSTLPKPFED